ncbi:hypothetical protein, partial [Mycobacterium sp.]|uniref:hypothetical protein n=1 Tax=Mycobacterium sp. TaxID=1785 RepID=UPI003F99E039
VQVPIPRAGGVGAPRIRDLELVQMVADLVSALDAGPRGVSSTAGATSAMTCADDDDPGVAGIVGVPPACGGEWRR